MSKKSLNMLSAVLPLLMGEQNNGLCDPKPTTFGYQFCDNSNPGYNRLKGNNTRNVTIYW